MDEWGPLQLIVIDFETAMLPTLVHAQLEDLRKRGLMRLVDSVVAVKGSDHELIVVDTLDSPRGDPLWAGVLAASLFGRTTRKPRGAAPVLGERSPRRPPELSLSEEQLLDIADFIPASTRALILLVEHTWVLDLNMAASEARGQVVANGWIAPEFLAKMLEREHPLLK